MSNLLHNTPVGHSSRLLSRLLPVLGFVILLIGLLFPVVAMGHTVDNDVFLQGKYVEVGIEYDVGCFGTSADAPSGYHPIGRNTLGFVADWGQDGWTTGTPTQTGDYFLPGFPEQGFTIEWDASGETTLSNNGGGFTEDITATSLVEIFATPGISSAIWMGQAIDGSDQLNVTRQVNLGHDKLYFTVDVTLENTGSTTLNSVEYLETVDPDNDKDLGGSYATTNTIRYQPGVGGNPDKALVIATGTVYSDVVMGLGAKDSRARVSIGGMANRDPDEVLNATDCTPGATVCAPSPGAAYQGDMAVSLAYDLGSLAPGESVSFTYVYVLSEAALEDALDSVGETQADLGLDKQGTWTGTTVTYTIVATNAGPEAVPGVVVSDTLSAYLTDATWSCVTSGGATCGGNGTGNISDTVDLPAGGRITYTLVATFNPVYNLVNSAELIGPADLNDPTPDNNSANVKLGLLRYYLPILSYLD